MCTATPSYDGVFWVIIIIQINCPCFIFYSWLTYQYWNVFLSASGFPESDCKDYISKCLSLLFGKLTLRIFLSFIMLWLLQPTANYDFSIIEGYLAGNTQKTKISIKCVFHIGGPWPLLLTGSAVPRISWHQIESLETRVFMQDTSLTICWLSCTDMFKV